jgi:hypothetical protein
MAGIDANSPSTPEHQAFYARGKLLLSGEYLVAHGGLALAIPVRFGQRLEVRSYALKEPADPAEAAPSLLRQSERSAPPRGPAELLWNAFREDGELWMAASLSKPDLAVRDWDTYGLEPPREPALMERLLRLLLLCRRANPDFLRDVQTAQWAGTHLEFARDWGLGTSSTLVSLLAQWSGTDPFVLQREVFGGSGYDIACATARGPLLYKLVNGEPRWEELDWKPPFSDRLFFVHLGRKQDSRFSLAAFEARGMAAAPWLNTLVHLTMQLRFAETLADFMEHLRKHEEVIAALTGFSPVQALHFGDFAGVVKSLGAWGGDFVLAASALPEPELRAYFAQRGYATVLSWREMVG